MFNIQDLESLNKLAHILVWPLMAAAFYSSYGLALQNQLPSPESWWYLIAFSAMFSIQVIVVSTIVEAIDFALDLLSKIIFEWLHAAFGLSILTVGLLPLHTIGQADVPPAISPLWAFACLTWGLRIFLPSKSG